MKLTGVILMAAVIALSGSAFAEEAGHEGHQGDMGCAMCPIKVEGAQVNVENTPDGVKIVIRSTDPAKVEEIQKRASHAREHMAEAYACPMGDHKSNAPGKCPTCGMDMVKK